MLRAIRYELSEWGRAILRSIPGEFGCLARNRLYGYHAGRACRVLTSVIVHHPAKLQLGANVGISPGTQVNAAGGIRIDSDTLIGPGCIIWSANHLYSSLERPIRIQGYDLKPVHIGPDCWIAAGCIILPGVTLGRGVVVAAGAVVTTSFSDYSVIAGVPARLLHVRNDAISGHQPASGNNL
jgi:acetyltransferase-like isoleucine patch superfamily enzyme